MIHRPHVCLRCQIRQAKRPTPSRPRIRPLQTAFQSTTAKLAPGEFEQDESQDNGDRNGKGDGSISAEAPPVEIRPAHRRTDYNTFTITRGVKPINRPRNVPLSEHPMGKLYGFAGRMQRESKEDLQGQRVLGQPARAIVLKESLYMKYGNTATKEIAAQRAESIDIMATMDNERGVVGQEEVNHNIHQLRPEKGQEPVDWQGFDDLVQELSSGFTGTQLTRYIQVFAKVPKITPSKSAEKDKDIYMRVTPWRAGISSSPERLSIEGQDDTFASYTAKQLLAVRLVGECWRLDPPEVDDGIGELELQVQPGDFELLMKGSNSTIASLVAKHNTKIQAFPKDHVLRVTNTREMSSLIVQEIREILRNVKRVKVHLGDLVPAAQGNQWDRLQQWATTHYSRTFMTELSLLTRTQIEVGRRQRLTISCIDETPGSAVPGSVTSNRADVARRLIVTSHNFSNRITHWLGHREVSNKNQGVFVPYPVTEGMTWHERLRHWTRWTTPVTKSEDGSPKTPTLPPLKSIAVTGAIRNSGDAVQNMKNRRKRMPSPPGYIYWSPDLWISNSCILGTILHSSTDAGSPVPHSIFDLKDINEDSSFKVQQSFSTKIPNISKVLSGLSAEHPNISLSSKGLPIEDLVLNFLPNPFFFDKKTQKAVGPSVLSTYPAVEMHFNVDPDTKDLTVKDIQAVVKVDNADLMLPDASVDVRFQQKTTSRLRLLHRKDYPASINKFLDNMSSSLNFTHGKLKTPPKIILPIAKHLYAEFPGPEKVFDAHEMQDVEYLYAGLEQRRRLTMDYDGWVIHYTFIESGRAGGRRGELRLKPVRTDRSETRKFTEEDFVKAALKIAEALDEGWVVRRVGEKLVRQVESKHQFFAKRVDIFYAGEGEEEEGEKEVVEEKQDMEEEKDV